MTFLQFIHGKVNEYIKENYQKPTGLSLGRTFFNDYCDLVSQGYGFVMPPYIIVPSPPNKKHYDYLHGMKINWVNRKDYVEVLPRKRKAKNSYAPPPYSYNNLS